MKKIFLNIIFIGLISLGIVGCSTQKTKDSTVSNSIKTTTDIITAGQKEEQNKINPLSEISTKDQFFHMTGFSNSNYNGYSDLTEMLESKDMLKRLKNLNADIKNNLTYVEMNIQHLVYKGHYDGDLKFTGYDGDEFANENSTDENGTEIFRTKLKTLMAGTEMYRVFDDRITKGSNFSKEDFIVNNPNQEINILLGSGYKDLYDIGDKLKLLLFERETNFNVIGFLKEGTAIDVGYKIPLDNRIIMPFYDINYEPTNQIEDFYQKNFYLTKLNGFLKVKIDENTEPMIEYRQKKSQEIANSTDEKEQARLFDMMYQKEVEINKINKEKLEMIEKKYDLKLNLGIVLDTVKINPLAI